MENFGLLRMPVCGVYIIYIGRTFITRECTDDFTDLTQKRNGSVEK